MDRNGQGRRAWKGRVLGIDPGLERTGYAVVQMPGARVCDAGVIRTTARATLQQRLCEIEAGLEEVLGEHTVELVAVEELFAHYAHPRTAILMGHARGVVLLAAARRGLPVVGIPATKIKRLLTGNGHAGKLQVQRSIMATFGLRKLPEPPDVADAMAIGWCAAMTARELEQPRRRPKTVLSRQWTLPPNVPAHFVRLGKHG